MKTWFTVLVFACLFASVRDASAKAAYFPKQRAVQMAEFIAIVEVVKVAPTEVKGAGWTYRQVAEANVEKVLKGELPARVKLYGDENFICAQVKYKPGRHLVFLREDGKLLTGVNWHLGVLPIDGETVQWFEDDKSIRLKAASLKTVVAEIEEIVRNTWPILVWSEHGDRRTGPAVKIAYWEDGTVLFRLPGDDTMKVGKVNYSAFWTMWSALRKADFFQFERESYRVPDASWETIAVNLGSESALRSWHAVLKRGFGGDVETDPAYRAFVEMWQSSTNALQGMLPAQGEPVTTAARNGTFRGYVLEKSSQTEWLNERKWKDRSK